MLQKFSKFGARERVENVSPFEKNRGDIVSLPRHPPPQIAAGALEQSRIAPQSPRDQAIRRRVVEIDRLMVPRSHGDNIDGGCSVRESLSIRLWFDPLYDPRRIVELRTSAGLSQRELAKVVGTTASVICRLEDADYEGHLLAMLRRIASGLKQRVEIRFVPLKSKFQAA